jgi:mRNA-degrading endonuclease RelE of RelBE toxin-antitoxin system
VAAVELSKRGLRDLRRVGPGPEQTRIADALRSLEKGATNLDVKAIQGRSPWLRLRVGDYRVLYRPVDQGWWVERIVSRGDLDRAVATL